MGKKKLYIPIEILREASKMKSKGMRIPIIMQILNYTEVSYHQFRWQLYVFERDVLKLDLNKNKIVEYEDSKVEQLRIDVESVDEYYDNLKKLEASAKKIDTKQTNCTIKLNDDKPICLAFWGDWHLGSKGVDYSKFDDDLELIKNTDAVYFIGMGDYIDNNSAYVTKATNENSIPQEMQRLLAASMIQQVSDKCLALIRGCHESFSYKVDGSDFVGEICLNNNCVNLWHGGMITLKLGHELYKIMARHRYKNESGLNTTNAHRNMLNNIGPCDVIAFAHLHFPDMQMLDRMGQKVIYFRSGSYKKYDDYGQKIGGYSAKPGIPCVILFPDNHKLVPFQEIEDAIIYLNSVRHL